MNRFNLLARASCALLAAFSFNAAASAQVDPVARGLAVQAQAQTTNIITPQQWWGRSFVAPKPIPIMATPPTVTVPLNSASTINSSNNAGNVPTKGLYANLNCRGFASSANSGINTLKAYAPANTDGTLPRAGLIRCRFTTIMPQFEVVFLENTGAKTNAIVDGAFVTAGGNGVIPNGLQSGNFRYLKFDFGADVPSFGVAAANLASAGTGYNTGDTITLTGGTCARAPTYRVSYAAAGPASGLFIQDAGDCTVLPSFPASTTTSGTGTGLTIGSGFTFTRHTTLKPRQVELLVEGGDLFGINYTAPASGEAAITPYTYNPRTPSLYWLGDSQDGNTYGTYAGGEMGLLVAMRLGLVDNFTTDARGGTGFNAPNGTAPAFEHPNRINALIAAKPDFVFIPYSQNVGSNTQATSTAACISAITAIQNGSPKTLIVLGGPAFGYQSWHLAAMQACVAAAPDPKRIRYIDSITEGWSSGGSAGYLTSDNVHWGQYGNLEWRSYILAQRFAAKLQEMIP